MTALAYQENTVNATVPFDKINPGTIHEVLLEIGVPPHLYGYSYLVYALELILIDPDCLHSVTKGLYIDIALKFKTQPAKVECAIRHAISATWLRGDAEVLNSIFKNCIKPGKGIPTNTVFLARLYYYITNRENVK